MQLSQGTRSARSTTSPCIVKLSPSSRRRRRFAPRSIQLGQKFPEGNNALDDLQNVFKPGGLLDLHKPPTLIPIQRYVAFFNRASQIQQALYGGGSALQMHYKSPYCPAQESKSSS